MKRRENFKGTEAWKKSQLKQCVLLKGQGFRSKLKFKVLSKYIHINNNKASQIPSSAFGFNSIWNQRTDAEATECGSLNTALTELARCQFDPWKGSICLMAWEQKAAFALGWVHLFCLEGGLHGNHKNSAFPRCSTYSRPTFLLCCWKKYLVYSVHQYNVCVCAFVCILFSSFKTMLHKLWFCTCKDRTNNMERAWRRWNVWSCAQSKVLSNANTRILAVVLACEILRGMDKYKRRNKTKQVDAI